MMYKHVCEYCGEEVEIGYTICDRCDEENAAEERGE